MNQQLKQLKYSNPIVYITNKYWQWRCHRLKKIIFVATTGRSGSMTLVDIFNQLPGCKAEHEPYPAMFNEVLTAKSGGDETFVKNIYWKIKSINLKRSASGYSYYLESNHMFIKTYIEYAVEDFGDKVSIIHLTRDPVKVANSIYSLQDFPGTVEGNKWWLDYTASNNEIQIADYLDNDPEFKHPFYKGLWYWYEVESRIKTWKTNLPHINFIPFQTEDFNDEKKIVKLLSIIGIDTTTRIIKNITSTKSNTRPHQKVCNPLPIELANSMHENFIRLLNSL